MKVLNIGSDPQLFSENSQVRARMQDYATLFDELHIVAMTPRGFQPYSWEGKLFIWPTCSCFSFMRWLDAARVGAHLVKERGITLLDAQDADQSGLAAFLVSRLRRVPFRIQIHTDIFSPMFRKASWKEWLRFRFAKILLPRATCIRVVSQRIKKTIIESGILPKAAKISVLPIFTDISRFLNVEESIELANRFSVFSFKMLAVGRFVDKEKNLSMLIELMADFIKVCPQALLVLVGDGPDKSLYESMIRRHNLGKNVIIEAWYRDPSSLYKSFDLFLLPSNYEGWGRVVIEAMASGVPVLMTDVGLAGEVVRDGINGVVVPVGDKKAFLQKMVDLYRDGAKRKKIGEEGRHTVSELWPFTQTEYLEMYRKSLISCL